MDELTGSPMHPSGKSRWTVRQFPNILPIHPGFKYVDQESHEVEFICKLCSFLCMDPIIAPCGHLFCTSCLFNSGICKNDVCGDLCLVATNVCKQGVCVVCEKEWTFRDIIDLDPIKDRVIRNACARAKVECLECHIITERGIKGEIFNKHKTEECPISCKYGCKDAKITRATWLKHKEICPLVEVSCGGKDLGCTVIQKRQDITQHQSTCTLYQLSPIFRKQQQELKELRSTTTKLTNEQQTQLAGLEKVNQEQQQELKRLADEHQAKLAELDKINKEQHERVTELDGRLTENTESLKNVINKMSHTKTYISEWFEVESNTSNTVVHKHYLKTIPISVTIQFTADIVKLSDGKLDTSNIKTVWDVTNNSHYSVGHESCSGSHHGGSYMLNSKEIHISFWSGGYVARQWSMERNWVQHKTGFYRVILQTSPGELKKGSKGCIIA